MQVHQPCLVPLPTDQPESALAVSHQDNNHITIYLLMTTTYRNTLIVVNRNVTEARQQNHNLPYRMLEAIMRSSNKNKVSTTQLLNVTQSLKLRSVNDFDHQGMNFYVSMNRVIKNLKRKHNLFLQKSMSTYLGRYIHTENYSTIIH